MAVGFWSKLVELAKKIWNGVKTGAEIATKYVMPIAKHTTSLLNKSDNKTVSQVGRDVREGLGKISPLISKLAQRDARRLIK